MMRRGPITIGRLLGAALQGVFLVVLVTAVFGLPALTVVALATGWDPLHLDDEPTSAQGGESDPQDAEPWPRAGWR